MITRASDPVPTEAQRLEAWRRRMAKRTLPAVRNSTLFMKLLQKMRPKK